MKKRSDYDNPWKMIVERQFEACMAFYFPHVYAVIDWAVEPKFLNQELQKIMGENKEKNRRADCLVEVRLLDGSDVWLLIHIEIQNKKDDEFEERMFIYFYRIYDKFKRYPVSLAILTDGDPNWRPHQHYRNTLNCVVTLDFPAVKLLDYDLDALKSSTNPFAFVTRAHLETVAVGKSDDRLYASKFRLMRLLLKSNYGRQEIENLIQFINWIMLLPTALEAQLQTDVNAVDKEGYEMYMTNWDRVTFNKGQIKGQVQNQIKMILRILKFRFGSVPVQTEDRLKKIEDIDKLDEISDRALRINSLEELDLGELDELDGDEVEA